MVDMVATLLVQPSPGLCTIAILHQFRLFLDRKNGGSFSTKKTGDQVASKCRRITGIAFIWIQYSIYIYTNHPSRGPFFWRLSCVSCGKLCGFESLDGAKAHSQPNSCSKIPIMLAVSNKNSTKLDGETLVKLTFSIFTFSWEIILEMCTVRAY